MRTYTSSISSYLMNKTKLRIYNRESHGLGIRSYMRFLLAGNRATSSVSDTVIGTEPRWRVSFPRAAFRLHTNYRPANAIFCEIKIRVQMRFCYSTDKRTAFFNGFLSRPVLRNPCKENKPTPLDLP